VESNADILVALALILCTGMLAGHLGQKIGLPGAVGKICIGLMLGPAVLGIVGDGPTLEALSGIGVVLLMFIAGLETDFETMKQVSVAALLVAIGGVVLPFFGGVGIGYLFDLPTSESLFLGAILTATSVSISADTLKELGLLQSKEGTTILAAAVIDDILGVIVLSFVFAVTGDGDPVVSIGKMALFLPLSLLVGWFITSRSAGKIEEHLSTETQLSVAISGALAYAWAAEHLGGVASVTGAYMAGLLLSRTRLVHSITNGLNWVGYSFFVPLFFVSIGFKADFGGVASAPLLVASLLLVSVVGKVVGCYVMARIARFSHQESLFVGVGMMSRGEVALVIAAAGLSAGAVGGSVFSASIIMTLLTTILTPVVLKFLHSRQMVGPVVKRNEAYEPAGAALAES
jgi:Kef-type K+ transport system membrane component KefB